MKNIFGFFLSLFNRIDVKRVTKNFVSELNSNLIRTVIQLGFPPLMIFIYGIEKFGIWIFLINIPYLISIFNINLNDASKIEMSIFYNKKD